MRWLLLRGLVREQRHWLDFPATFAAAVRSPDGRPTTVTTLDLPGFGTEHAAPVPPTVAGFVERLRSQWRRAADPTEPAGILAVSLGGMVALDWLARFPADFAAGVIVNSSLADLSPPWQRLQPRNWPRVFVAPWLPTRARERLLLGMTRTHGDLERDADRYAAIAAAPRPRRAAAVGQLRAAMRMRCPDRLGVPALVLTSRGDRLVSWRCSQAIATRLDLPLRVHHSAGHDLPLDAPDWVCAQVDEWLAGLPPPGPHRSP